MLPIAAIVGRSNVGKSALFNRFAGRKKAIVHSLPGVTRDRNEYEVFWKDSRFIIADAAGWAFEESVFSSAMAHQLEISIDKASLILFTVDLKTGINGLDIKIAEVLRKIQKKTILVVNKADDPSEESAGFEFYKLGFKDLFFVSSIHGRGISELLDKIVSVLPHTEKIKREESIKIALAGKPNVGKSSFMNAAVKEERSIVHDKAGTTRDSLSVAAFVNGRRYILTDTAGLHRGNKRKDDMEYLSTLSASRAIEDSDITVLIMDAGCEIGETECKIAGLIGEKQKAVIIAVNKWDLIEENKEEAAKFWISQIRLKLKFIPWADIIFISAKTGQRIDRVFETAVIVYKEYSKQILPEQLKETINAAVYKKPLIRKGKRLKIKNTSQISIRPPIFMFEVNDLDLVHFSYKRYLENVLRAHFGFKGTPIVLKFKR